MTMLISHLLTPVQEKNTMFRRPVLGAAVVYGVSRSAARREMEKEEQRRAEAQISADRAAERQRRDQEEAQLSAQRAADKQKRDEEEREKRTQLAIDEAIAKERNKYAAVGAEPRSTIANTGGTGIIEAYDNVPPYSSYNRNPAADEDKGTATHYCPECCNVCRRGDKFCSKCGCRQPVDV
jgi:hypothetical protein